MRFIIKIFFISLLTFNFGLFYIQAEIVDTDNDGLSDYDELNIYYSNPNNPDTDGDGYDDWTEIKNGYSPINPKKVTLKQLDADKDGLSDDLELKFKTDLMKIDSDSDGYNDGDEIKNGFDPLSKENKKLEKTIEINLKQQKLSYFLSSVELGSYPVSTGVNNSTPKGSFKIINKHPKAWSSYGLWMPYWLGLHNGKFGIHELPVWPNGHREGEKSLGHPASHGCIRLGMGPAKIIYDWTEVGTPVLIY
jgi:hypothetical protein